MCNIIVLTGNLSIFCNKIVEILQKKMHLKICCGCQVHLLVVLMSLLKWKRLTKLLLTIKKIREISGSSIALPTVLISEKKLAGTTKCEPSDVGSDEPSPPGYRFIDMAVVANVFSLMACPKC